MTLKHMSCIGLASLLLAGGCAGIPRREDSYKQLMTNMKEVEDSLEQLQSPSVVPGTDGYRTGKALKLPLMEARFCVQRALDAVQRAEHNSGGDMSLIILGGSGLAYGMAASAGAAALPEASDHRQWLLLSGAVSTAAAAGIYALRTALSLSDVAREHRIAAARNVDAALGILMHYAVTDDGLLTEDDDFITCRDSDIAIAKAYPGVKTQEPSTAKQSEQVARDKQSAKAAQDAEAEAKATYDKKEAEAKAQTASTQAALETLRVAVQDAAQAVKGTKSLTATNLVNEVMANSKDIRAASERLVGAAEMIGADNPKAETVKKAADSVKAQTEKLEQKKKEVDSAKAKADVAQCEADRATAKADVAEKQLDALRAATRFRRAVLLLTPADVSISGRLLKDSFEDLGKSKKALENLQKASCPAKEGGATS